MVQILHALSLWYAGHPLDYLDVIYLLRFEIINY